MRQSIVLLVVLLAGCATQHTATPASAGATCTVTFTSSSWCTDGNRSISIDGKTYRVGDHETMFTVDVMPGVHSIEYSIGSRPMKSWRNKEITKATTLSLPCTHVWNTQQERKRE